MKKSGLLFQKTKRQFKKEHKIKPKCNNTLQYVRHGMKEVHVKLRI